MPQRVTPGGSDQLKRLFAAEGDWTLELEYLQSIMDGAVLRPAIRRVFGRDAIFDALSRIEGQAELVRQAREVLTGPAATEAYEVVDGRWVRKGAHAVEAMIAEIRAEATEAVQQAPEAEERDHTAEILVQRMEARLEHIERRLDRLEELVSLGQFAPPASQVHIASVPEPPASPVAPLSEQPLSEQPVLPVAEKLEPEQAYDSTPAEPAASPASEQPGEPEPPPGPAIPAIPPAGDFQEVLRILIDDEISIDSVPSTVEPSDKMFISDLLDDDDNLVGALMLDMRGANNLGGKLMMIPDGTIDEMIANREVSEETLDGASEVLNTLSSCVNKIRRNPHVRTTPARPWEPDQDGW
ncbi:MAG: hypothetical protein ACOC1F_09545, partial [Myxococcota bacterium]